MLENTLRSFSALTKGILSWFLTICSQANKTLTGETIRIIYNRKIYDIDVVDVKPRDHGLSVTVFPVDPNISPWFSFNPFPPAPSPPLYCPLPCRFILDFSATAVSAGAISIIDADVNVDFDAPADYEEPVRKPVAPVIPTFRFACNMRAHPCRHSLNTAGPESSWCGCEGLSGPPPCRSVEPEEAEPPLDSDKVTCHLRVTGPAGSVWGAGRDRAPVRSRKQWLNAQGLVDPTRPGLDPPRSTLLIWNVLCNTAALAYCRLYFVLCFLSR